MVILNTKRITYAPAIIDQATNQLLTRQDKPCTDYTTKNKEKFYDEW